MHVRVLYFASLRERRGLDEETVSIEPGSTIASLYARLFDGAPTVAFTRNRSIVSGNEELEDGDEISFLPPLGGG